jgi:(2Fe-2S) ferredoxin
MRLYVCHGPTCAARVRPVWSALHAEVQRLDLDDQCELIVSGCLSRCDDGPNINVYPNLTKYAHVTPDDARRIVAEHVAEGQPVAELRVQETW